MVAAKMGVDASNSWTTTYIVTLLIDMIIMESMTIVIQIVMTPYIKTHMQSGKY